MKTLNVSCIQHFSTGDGPGIRTTVFLKGCRQRCPWCHNPENVPDDPVTVRYGTTGKSVIYGNVMTFDEILSEVIADKEFYLASGGGVTFSGGEPMLQSKALSEFEEIIKENGIHTLIDTAGCVPWEAFEDVIDLTDTFFCDYKTADASLYKTVVKGDRDLVLCNIRRLVEAGKDVRARVPLIPGFNIDPAGCEKMCEDLLRSGVKNVDLLPFHRLGSSKYAGMGLEYAYGSVAPPGEGEISGIRSVFEKYFRTTVE
ncbi:MAG: radical SAM protein [Clostridia bacterium]|nr:radical SAM protein [Clostridia bacterium]